MHYMEYFFMAVILILFIRTLIILFMESGKGLKERLRIIQGAIRKAFNKDKGK